MEGEQNIEAVASKPKSSKLWLVIVIVIVLLGAGVGGYLVFAGKSSGSSSGGVLSGIVPKKLNPNCKYNDPDLCKFMNNWKEVKYLTMNSSDTIDGKTNTAVYKMEGDDNTQIIMSESGKESYNAITIGKTTYTKDYTDNKWFKYTPKETDENFAEDYKSDIDFDESLEEAEDKTTYEKMGTETCGKLTCFKYKEIDPEIQDSTNYIFFDNKDYQLRKTRNESKDGSISEATYDYTKFSISEPSPVKEGNPFESLTPSASTASPPVAPQATTQTSPQNTTSTTEADIPVSSSDDYNYDNSTSTDSVTTPTEDSFDYSAE